MIGGGGDGGPKRRHQQQDVELLGVGSPGLQVAVGQDCGRNCGNGEQALEEERIAIDVQQPVDVLHPGRKSQRQDRDGRPQNHQCADEGDGTRTQPRGDHQQDHDAAREHQQREQRRDHGGRHGSTPNVAIVAPARSSTGCG